MTFFTAELEGKRLGLLRELVPQATALAALVNPTNANAENQSKELTQAARTLGLQLDILSAMSEREIRACELQIRAAALVVASDPTSSKTAKHPDRGESP